MRQVSIVCVTTECILKDAHSRKAVRVAQVVDLRCNDPEVLGNDGYFAELGPYSFEKLIARHIHPCSVLGGFVVPWNFPCADESPEMIQTNDIDLAESAAKPRDPPSKSIAPHRIPVINRISPKLPRRRKVIGWYTGHDLWRSVIV